MRRFTSLAVIALSAGIAATSSAASADYNWTGFYLGGNIGGAWGSFDPKTTTPGDRAGEFDPTSITAFNAAGNQYINPGAFTFGFETGYNWQVSALVAGLESDIESFQLRGSATSGPVVYPCCAPSTFTVSSSASTSWLATLRGRVGFAADNWLFYYTGGAAFTTLQGSFSFSETFYNAPAESASLSSAKGGYTVGGGVEAAFWQHWSFKAEYLYVNFGTVTTTGIYGPPVLVSPLPFAHIIDLRSNIVRLGVNYHF